MPHFLLAFCSSRTFNCYPVVVSAVILICPSDVMFVFQHFPLILAGIMFLIADIPAAISAAIPAVIASIGAVACHPLYCVPLLYAGAGP